MESNLVTAEFLERFRVWDFRLPEEAGVLQQAFYAEVVWLLDVARESWWTEPAFLEDSDGQAIENPRSYAIEHARRAFAAGWRQVQDLAKQYCVEIRPVRSVGLYITGNITHREVDRVAVLNCLSDLSEAVARASGGSNLGPPGDDSNKREATPVWDSETSQLKFEGNLCRTVGEQGKNLKLVLNAFQEVGWPRRLDDPDPRGSNAARVNNTRTALNEGLSCIVFGVGDGGESYTWRPVQSVKKGNPKAKPK